MSGSSSPGKLAAIKDEQTGRDEANRRRLPKRKLKMRLKRLFLDDNEQSEDALKHIYTLLLSNTEIEVSINLPYDLIKNESESSESSSEEIEP